MLTEKNKAAIQAEYERLRALLGLPALTLDIYEHNPESTDQTESGTPIASGDPAFSASQNIIRLPVCPGDTLPTEKPQFPVAWSKRQSEWDPWRIELWHEVIHQLSAHRGVYNSLEQGRTRADGSKSSIGRGDGWWTAIQAAANALKVVTAEDLDALLDG